MKQILALVPLLSLGCSGDKDSPTDTNESFDTGVSALDCADQMTPATPWFAGETLDVWPGDWEFGQTHVVGATDPRYASPIIEERETLVLFTPASNPTSDADIRLSAWMDDLLLGTLVMQPPEHLPDLLEQALTDAPLEPYRSTAWSATLPWDWDKEGVTLKVGTPLDSGIQVAEHSLEDLGAPQRFTVTRSKIVLFGDESIDTRTRSAEQISQDFYASVPVAEMRWVDTTDWVLDEFVVSTVDGYRMVHSESERLSVTKVSYRWNPLKHQFSLRMSAANTGRGLVLNEGWEGDSSPYGFGTSVVMGWVVDEDGNASDIDDAGVAAGWTGWTAMWAEECGNTFIHEIGHSMTLNHFTAGTANSWGIGDQYPNDGQHMSDHPWGYDSTRRQFRTWYQVSSNGPVEGDDAGFNGKYDPMNGGEAANAVTCFPQYTGYHAAVIQNWSEQSPTLAVMDGEPGAWMWNAYDRVYEPHSVDSAHQAPLGVDVPVVTLIGTIGGLEEATQQTYPPIFAISGNHFELPDPEETELSTEFDGAQWFLDIHYADGSLDRALIAVGEVAETDLRVFSLNLESERDPVQVDLRHSDTPWPKVDVRGATLVHTRLIEAPHTETLPPVVTVGRGMVANGALRLTVRCTPGLDCDNRDATSNWQLAGMPLTFHDAEGQISSLETCLEHDDFSTLTIPVVHDNGTSATVVVHAQRQVHGGSQTISVPLNDATHWIDSAELRQSIRIWLPYDENDSLPEGHYQVDGDFRLEAQSEGVTVAEIPIELDLTIDEAIEAVLEEDVRVGPVSQDDSSVYFQVVDSTMGPNYGVWWDDWEEGPPTLTVPVVNEASGEATTVFLDAYKLACDSWWISIRLRATKMAPAKTMPY